MGVFRTFRLQGGTGFAVGDIEAFRVAMDRPTGPLVMGGQIQREFSGFDILLGDGRRRDGHGKRRAQADLLLEQNLVGCQGGRQQQAQQHCDHSAIHHFHLVLLMMFTVICRACILLPSILPVSGTVFRRDRHRTEDCRRGNAGNRIEGLCRGTRSLRSGPVLPS